MMLWPQLTFLAVVAPYQVNALLRFPCGQLVIDRLDPLVTPGQVPAPHLHQIVGGVSYVHILYEFRNADSRSQNAFNASMDPAKDLPGESTCTTCQFSEDFSNYWTATLYVLNGARCRDKS